MRMKNPTGKRGRLRGFTLVEMMAATAVFALLMAMVFAILGSVADIWRKSSGKVEAFQGARLAYNLITRSVSQATLNTYLGYDDPLNPREYLRRSELQFVCLAPGVGNIPGVVNSGTAFFFQAPATYTDNRATFGGLDDALNVYGYYIAFANESARPAFLPPRVKYRYRLMQLLVPMEKNQIFVKTGVTEFGWFTDYCDPTDLNNYAARPVADNVIALIVRPQDPDDLSLFSTSYDYNSRSAAVTPQPVTANQLPPVMKVTMVAIDETSASRMDSGTSQPSLITEILVGRFKNPSNYETDLQYVKSKLADANVNFRVFESAVPMRESKWTK